MATSPREELVVEAVVEFAEFYGKFVWAEKSADATTVLDSGDKEFDTLEDAVADFMVDEGVEMSLAVDPVEAHYSKVQHVADDSWIILKYKYGAPEPIQRVM